MYVCIYVYSYMCMHICDTRDILHRLRIYAYIYLTQAVYINIAYASLCLFIYVIHTMSYTGWRCAALAYILRNAETIRAI